MISLAEIAKLAARHLELADQSFVAGDEMWAASHALVSIAASLYRLQATPVTVPRVDDPLDYADPFQSETERYWDEKTERRLDRD